MVIIGSNIFMDGWSLALPSQLLNSVSVLRKEYMVAYDLSVM